jgi:uncharacterized protein (DUF1501 family)
VKALARVGDKKELAKSTKNSRERIRGAKENLTLDADWPGIKNKNLFEGRDLNSTLDARSVYCSAMSVCFDTDFQLLNTKVFPDGKLNDLTEILFKV